MTATAEGTGGGPPRLDQRGASALSPRVADALRAAVARELPRHLFRAALSSALAPGQEIDDAPMIRAARPQRSRLDARHAPPRSDLAADGPLARLEEPSLLESRRAETARANAAVLADALCLRDHDAAQDAARKAAEAHLAAGGGLEGVCLDVLAPAAHTLGRRWEDDEISFVDVTIAMGRLHKALRGLLDGADAAPATTSAQGPLRRVILTALPGEQHLFGLSMLSRFFRRAGWRVEIEPGAGPEVLAARVAEGPCVVGLTLGGTERADEAARLLAALRAQARGAPLTALVGGAAAQLDPTLGARIGADGTPGDARAAVDAAERALAASSARGATARR